MAPGRSEMYWSSHQFSCSMGLVALAGTHHAAACTGGLELWPTVTASGTTSPMDFFGPSVAVVPLVMGSLAVVGSSLLMGAGLSPDSGTGGASVVPAVSFLPPLLGLRKRLASFGRGEVGVDFCLVSPSVTSLSELSPFFSFLVPRLPKSEVRRFSRTGAEVDVVGSAVVV